MVGRMIRMVGGAGAGAADLLLDAGGAANSSVGLLAVTVVVMGVVAGLLAVVLVPLYARFRPDPAPGTAPSGARPCTSRAPHC